MNRRTALKAGIALALIARGPATAVEHDSDMEEAFARYQQARKMINDATADIGNYGPEWDDYYYWRARFWASPCHTHEQLCSKVRSILSDGSLQDDLHENSSIDLGFSDVGALDALFANILGDPVTISHTLREDIRHQNAQEEAEEVERRRLREIELAAEPRYKNVRDVP
jgi:hypothetical protein